MQKGRHGRTTTTRAGTAGTSRAKQRAYLIAALEEGDDLSELRELLRTAGVDVVGQSVQHRDRPHPNSYLGPGKLEEVKAAAKARRREPRRLPTTSSRRARSATSSRSSGCPVVDRTATILDIFAAHAHTAEGKLQVELAQLEYNLARMRGLWTPPRAPGRRLERRLRDPRPGRVADRDRPPPGARPDRRAAPAARGRQGLARDDARRARPRAPAAGRAGRLHERRQVDAPQRADRRERRRARPPLPHAGPDDPRRCGSTGAPTS